MPKDVAEILSLPQLNINPKMKSKLIGLAMLSFVACKENPQYDMTVTGSIKGLKKGTLYLQKLNDTLLQNIDSMVIDGDETFVLQADLASAELFFLHLDKYDGSKADNTIPFFAEKDTVYIYSTLKKFVADAKIKGSENQDRLNEFREMISQFNNKRLDLIKAQFEARQKNLTEEAEKITGQLDNLLKRQYLYVANFAVTHNDSEIAPYLALVEIYDATTPILDTVYKSLTPTIKDSKYGKELGVYIQNRKKEEAADQPID